MRRQTSIALLSVFIVVGTLSSVDAQDDGCVTDDCHATIGTARWVHGPVGVGACTVCHNRVDNKDHEFQFAMEKEELCFACHEDNRDMMQENHLHTPVASGECTGCHDPHQSEYRFSLKDETKQLCFNCHDTAMFAGEHVHGPVAVGDCNACHDPHASPHRMQLVAAPEVVCYQCHNERSDIQDRRHPHPPVQEDCRNCHEPHASPSKFLLAEQSPALCLECHEDIAESMHAEITHDPVSNGSCGECHDVHGSEHPMLLPAPMTEVCYRCHPEFEEYIAQQDFRHGPIQEDDCIACHDPHGSAYHRILKKYFPEEFYVGYREENYAMCFECHNRQIAMEEETETLTDFRDEKINLHYVHVNKIEKGRSCRACHQVHASSQAKHIRISVPYGSMKWELPVKFTKTENGGSCEVGCHSPKDYSR
jgi:predicted CXXCH cytochrome family protein